MHSKIFSLSDGLKSPYWFFKTSWRWSVLKDFCRYQRNWRQFYWYEQKRGQQRGRWLSCFDSAGENRGTHVKQRWRKEASRRYPFTAISRKVVGKNARDNPERYCGWFWVLCSSKKFEKMARKTKDICLRVLKESNKSMFDSYSRQEQCIDHIPYYLLGLSRAHFFRQPFSNNCIHMDNLRHGQSKTVSHEENNVMTQGRAQNPHLIICIWSPWNKR